MNCRSVESHFSEFLDDALSQAERRSFEAHLLSCRRCSQSLREMKVALALLAGAAKETVAETSPHFEDDLMARIRSGEAMRPTLIEWLQGLLAPERLRPVFMAGAAACALFIAVVLVQQGNHILPGPRSEAPEIASSDRDAISTPSGSTLPGEATPSRTIPPAESAESRIASSAPAPPTVASSAPARRAPAVPADAMPVVTGGDAPNGVIEVVDRVVPGSGTDIESAIPNPNALFADEYVTDQFVIQRGRPTGGSPQPSAVPVTDRGSDDVYIEF